MRIFIIILLIILQFDLQCQDIKIDNTFFLLGMIGEKSPKHIDNIKYTIEAISPNDTISNQIFYSYLTKLRDKRFKDEEIRIDTLDWAIIYSNSKIKKYLDSFYKDVDIYGELNGICRVAIIDEDKFIKKDGSRNTERLCSYITGAFVRHGYTDSNYYYLRFPNSMNHARLLASMISYLSSGIVVYEQIYTAIPIIVTIKFELPDDDLFKRDIKLEQYLEYIKTISNR
jgi:hypothetical protein